MTPEIRRAFQHQLVRHEGLKLSAYQDSLGYWTIGVGRLIDARRGGTISEEEAFYLLEHDIDTVVRECYTAFPWFEGLDEIRQRVIADMAFNLGISGLKKFTRTLAAIAQGDYDLAASRMLQSLWSKQVGRRAIRLAKMMETGLEVA